MMKPMRSRCSYSAYKDCCAAAHALDLIGERWALIMVRELFLGDSKQRQFVDDPTGPAHCDSGLNPKEGSWIKIGWAGRSH